MKKQFMILILLSIVTMLAHAQKIDFSAANVSITKDNSIILDGVRVDGFGYTLNDTIRVKYDLNLGTMGFDIDMENLVVFQGAGVFHELCMFNDVQEAQPSYTATVDAKTGKSGEETIVPTGQQVTTGESAYEFTATGSTPFVANFDLQTGHVMSFYISGVKVISEVKPKPNVKYRFIGPNTEIEGIIEVGYAGLLKPIKILASGEYEFRVEPSNLEDSVTFKLNTFNANNRLITQLTVDEKKKSKKLAERLAKGAWDYAKFQVTLNPGDNLEVPALKKQRASDSENWEKNNEKSQNLAIKLVDKTSHVVAYADNFQTLTYQNTTGKTNDYYLCVYDKVAGGAGYGGDVFILAEGEEKPKPKKPKKPKPDESSDELILDDTLTSEEPGTEQPPVGDA